MRRSIAYFVLSSLAISSFAASYTVNIDVKDEWFNSGIYIMSGDTLNLTGFGAVSMWNPADTWYNMSTTGPFLGSNGHTVPGYPAPALIGRIGETQMFMAAGTVRLVSEWEGFLYFTVNDQADAYFDNTGTAIVWLNIRRSTIASQENPRPTSNSIQLQQNRPNPFSTKTKIRYSIENPGNVTIAIYDQAGHRVRTINNYHDKSGTYEMTWDGRNDSGLILGSAAYFYQIIQNNDRTSKSMILLK